MKKIYLVQCMQRVEFKQCAHNRIKVGNLDCNGLVQTMWCESKINAINDCRSRNREQNDVVYFVNQIHDWSR